MQARSGLSARDRSRHGKRPLAAVQDQAAISGAALRRVRTRLQKMRHEHHGDDRWQGRRSTLGRAALRSQIKRTDTMTPAQKAARTRKRRAAARKKMYHDRALKAAHTRFINSLNKNPNKKLTPALLRDFVGDWRT